MSCCKGRDIMNFEQTKERALCILDLRMHSREELRKKLIQKGGDACIVSDVLDELEEYGLINDSEYARILIEHLSQDKGFGKRRIRSELARRGVSADAAQLAMEEADDDDERERLYPLMEHKLGGDFDKKNTDRAVRYFAARGYSLSDIFACIDAVRENAQTEEE